MSEPSSVSEFGPRQTSAHEVLIRERSGWTKVGRGGPEFGFFDGFHELSVLTSVMGLSFSGIIINAQVMFLSA